MEHRVTQDIPVKLAGQVLPESTERMALKEGTEVRDLKDQRVAWEPQALLVNRDFKDQRELVELREIPAHRVNVENQAETVYLDLQV